MMAILDENNDTIFSPIQFFFTISLSVPGVVNACKKNACVFFSFSGKHSVAVQERGGGGADPVKGEAGMQHKVTAQFRGSVPPNPPPPPLPPLQGPALLSEICQNTFHTNRYFSVFKASLMCLTCQSSSNSVKSAMPVRRSSPGFQHASFWLRGLKLNESKPDVTCHTLKW